jgi:cytochrome d ubiquinol oxidase subunit II
LGAGLVVFVMAWTAFWLAGDDAPLIRDGLGGRQWSVPFQGVTGMTATGALAALWVRWYHAARMLAMAQVALMILGWGMAQFPLVVAPDLTLVLTAAPESVLRALLIALAAGVVVLIPSFWYLYAVFKWQKAAESCEHVQQDDGQGIVEIDEEM